MNPLSREMEKPALYNNPGEGMPRIYGRTLSGCRRVPGYFLCSLMLVSDISQGVMRSTGHSTAAWEMPPTSLERDVMDEEQLVNTLSLRLSRLGGCNVYGSFRLIRGSPGKMSRKGSNGSKEAAPTVKPLGVIKRRCSNPHVFGGLHLLAPVSLQKMGLEEQGRAGEPDGSQQ